MIIELEKGVWIAGAWQRRNEYARTLVKEYAHDFKTIRQAHNALAVARTYFPFKNARIIN